MQNNITVRLVYNPTKWNLDGSSIIVKDVVSNIPLTNITKFVIDAKEGAYVERVYDDGYGGFPRGVFGGLLTEKVPVNIEGIEVVNS